MRSAAALLTLALLALSACDEKKPDWAKETARGNAIPAQACAQVKKALDQLRTGGADYTDAGEATIPMAAWQQMPPQQQDQLAKTLAYHASCAAGAENDAQEVRIRGDDGSVLLTRTLSTRVDASDILGGE